MTPSTGTYWVPDTGYRYRVPDVREFGEERGDAAHESAHQEGGAEDAEEVGHGLHHLQPPFRIKVILLRCGCGSCF